MGEGLEEELQQGVIIIQSIDEVAEEWIVDVEYEIIDMESNTILQTIGSNREGVAVSEALDYEKTYIVRQSNIANPYQLNEEEFHIELEDEEYNVKFENIWHDHIKKIKYMDRDIEITEVFIPVNPVLQNPELPNGCEITSLTSVLNYYGYDTDKLQMADIYLPKQPFARKEGKLYGANPFEAYAGDPRDGVGGFFCYAPPLLEAANSYFNDFNGSHNPLDISMSDRGEIIDYLNKGIPIVIWVPIDLQKPRINYSWYFHETGELFNAPVNLHCVVLNGYVNGDVHVMDPLKGQILYDSEAFFEGYYALGQHAMLVSASQNN